MKSIAFHNLGCKVNSYEMEVMQQIVQKRGYEIVEFSQKSDIYVVNTCTVTNIADRKSRQMLHRAKQQNPDAVVVAAGCYAQTGIEALKKDLAVDIIIGNNHKTEIADILDAYFAEHEEKKEVFSDLSVPAEYETAFNYESTERTRADVKIQDGCNQFCAYCAIPLARGRVRSRKPEEIIDEILHLTENGHKEIILTGIHISSYGIDFDDDAWKAGRCEPSEHESLKAGEMMRDYRGGTKLFDLIELIERRVPNNVLSRIRIGSLEPRIVTPENVQRLIAAKRVCPHFHLSLQSGCDSVLRRMNRHYDTADYERSVELLRSEYARAGKRVAVTTDVIVGFPGETDEEFSITESYLERLSLYEMHVFKYSRRKNTVADKMPGQVDEKVKAARSDILLTMTAKQSREYRRPVLGTDISVLIEEERDGYLIGHTEDYIRVAVAVSADSGNGLVSELVTVHADDLMNDETVLGTIVR